MIMAVSIGFGLVGVGAISIISYHLHLSNAEPVEATVVHSGAPQKYQGDIDKQRVLNVVYEFQYSGDEQLGEGVYAGVGPATMPVVRSTRSVADRYQEGETVTAYVVDYNDPSYSPSYTYLIGEGPRYYAYYVFIALGALISWAGISIWLYQVFGIDLPMRARLEE